MTIEEESGAKVTFLKDRRTEKYRATQQEGDIENRKEELQNESAKDGEQNERKDVEEPGEPQSETIRERNVEESKEHVTVREEGKFQDEQKAVESGICSEERQSGGDLSVPEKGNVKHKEIKTENIGNEYKHRMEQR